MRETVEFMRQYDAYFLTGLSVLSLVFLISLLSVSRQVLRLRARRNVKLAEGHVEDIVSALTELSNSVTVLEEQIDSLKAGQDAQAKMLAECLQRVGIVRFNAFDDVGGEQSFALALLDSNNRGIVVSSLYGRQDSRFYAKEITDGNGDRALSNEEREALRRAIS